MSNWPGSGFEGSQSERLQPTRWWLQNNLIPGQVGKPSLAWAIVAHCSATRTQLCSEGLGSFPKAQAVSFGLAGTASEKDYISYQRKSQLAFS